MNGLNWVNQKIQSVTPQNNVQSVEQEAVSHLQTSPPVLKLSQLLTPSAFTFNRYHC
ncbi:MAG TPA: hypothetical protein V6D26_00420 [Stenomitos sp.]